MQAAVKQPGWKVASCYGVLNTQSEWGRYLALAYSEVFYTVSGAVLSSFPSNANEGNCYPRN